MCYIDGQKNKYSAYLVLIVMSRSVSFKLLGDITQELKLFRIKWDVRVAVDGMRIVGYSQAYRHCLMK
jgi:hypothetical protein